MSFELLNSILKLPSKSVATPFVVPLTTTVAPGNGTWFSSNTVPVKTVWECATKLAKTANNVINSVLFILFVFVNFGLLLRNKYLNEKLMSCTIYIK